MIFRYCKILYKDRYRKFLLFVSHKIFKRLVKTDRERMFDLSITNLLMLMHTSKAVKYLDQITKDAYRDFYKRILLNIKKDFLC